MTCVCVLVFYSLMDAFGADALHWRKCEVVIMLVPTGVAPLHRHGG
jgi:hypothetical protein